MKEMELLWKKKLLFSGVFVQENRLHAILDRNLNGITTKQWLLLVVSSSLPNPPDLTTLGKILGCSRQNIKKLALSLEKEGFIKLTPSYCDKRSLCVSILDKGKTIIEDSKEMEYKVYGSLFRDFSEEDISEYFKLSEKFSKGIGYLEECFISLKEKEEI